MPKQNLHCRRRNPAHLSSRVLRKPRQEKTCQVRYVFLPFPQRWNVNRHNVQPVIKVLAKCPLLQRRSQIAIRRRQQPNIDLNRARSSQPLKLTLLKHAQQLHLCRRRHIANLVEK